MQPLASPRSAKNHNHVQDLGYSSAFNFRIPGCPDQAKRSMTMASFKPFVNRAMGSFKRFGQQRSFGNQQQWWGKRSVEKKQSKQTQEEKRNLRLMGIKLLNTMLRGDKLRSRNAFYIRHENFRPSFVLFLRNIQSNPFGIYR